MNKVLSALLAGAGALALMSSPSHAILQFSADVGGNIFSCVDGAACDTDNTVNGTITTGTLVFGAITFLGSAQTQTTGLNNTLNTTSFQINNTGPAISVTIAVGGIDFVGPVTSISNSGSGTWSNAIGSNIQLTYYADPNNAQGGESPTDHPGILQADSGVLVASQITDSFNFNQLSAFSDPNLYSMTLQTVGTLAAGTVGTPSQLTGRSQAMVAVNEVPEPASLLILGGSLLGMGALMRFRRRRDGTCLPA